MNRSALVVSAALAAAVAFGAADFHRALDPGRAEAGGVTLNFLVQQGNGSEANDWYLGQSGVRARSQSGHVVVRGGPEDGFQLVSRPIPVYAHRLYLATVRVRASESSNGRVEVTNGELTQAFATARVGPAGSARTVALRFTSGSDQRVTIVLLGSPHARLDLLGARLEPA